MVDVVGVTIFGNESRGSVGVVVVQGKFVMGWLGGLSRERGIRALLEMRPAISSQENGVLHSSCRSAASPHC